MAFERPIRRKPRPFDEDLRERPSEEEVPPGPYDPIRCKPAAREQSDSGVFVMGS